MKLRASTARATFSSAVARNDPMHTAARPNVASVYERDTEIERQDDSRIVEINIEEIIPTSSSASKQASGLNSWSGTGRRAAHLDW